MRKDEEAVLAALIADSSAILELDLAPEHFSDEHGAALYRAMLSLATQGIGMDPFALGDAYGNRESVIPWFDPNGPAASPQNVKLYADQVKEASRLRHIQHVAEQAAAEAQEGHQADQVMDKMLGELTASETKRNVWTMQELQARSLQDIAEAKEAFESGGYVGVPTGFSGIDRIFGGLRGGNLYVLGARPKMGKTGWLLSAQHNAARAGHNIGFASAEMSAPECNKRWLASVAGVEADKLINGKLTDKEEQRVTKASNNLAQLPIHILDQASASPSRIRRQAMSWQRRYGLDCLMIDYLQRLTPDHVGERRDLVVGEMVRGFKSVARDLDIPVVLLAQLNRDLEKRDDKRPIAADMRDSGEIEQEADALCFLYRDAAYNELADPTDAEFLIRMNRHGDSGVVRLHFDAAFQRWLDKDMHDYGEAM